MEKNCVGYYTPRNTVSLHHHIVGADLIKNSRLVAILDFISAKFVMGYPCVRRYILFHIHGPAILHFFGLRKYHKITQIQNSR